MTMSWVRAGSRADRRRATRQLPYAGSLDWGQRAGHYACRVVPASARRQLRDQLITFLT